MARLRPDNTRTVKMETQTRSIDLPVDGTGHLRRKVIDLPTPVLLERAAGGDGPKFPFQGSFIPFGQRQWIGSKRWGYWEVNAPGCITKTISEKKSLNNDITFNRDHDNKLLLARTYNDTLRLRADDRYGYADADMGDYSYTADIVTALGRRDLTGMSYAFDMIDYEWSIAEDGYDLLTIREMDLFDVAVVGMPANVDTDCDMRMDLLAVARSVGFEPASFNTLALRLADPDPDVIAVLRSLANEAPSIPPTLPEEDQQRSTPPPDSTGINPLNIATLTMRTNLIGEKI